jgi:hypothetical protein
VVDRGAEFSELLEALSFEITNARSTGVRDPEQLRDSTKRIRDLAADLDALSGSMVAEERQKAE